MRTALLGLAIAAGAVAANPVVRLPPYTVQGAPALPPKEEWRHLEIPGYEIISQATDARTGDAAAFLLRTERIAERTFPAIGRTQMPQAGLILCTNRPEFESFVPAAVRAEIPVAEVDRLFLIGPRGTAIVLYLGSLAGAGDFEVDLAGDYLRRRLATARPPLPPWYIEGITRIFAAADVTDWRSHQTVAIGKLDDRPLPNGLVQGSDGSVSAQPTGTMDPSRAVTTDVAQIVRGDVFAAMSQVPGAATDLSAANPDFDGLGFRRYFSGEDRPVPKLASLLSGPARTGYADWSEGCCLFVHFCVFGQRGKFSRALGQFLDQWTPRGDPGPAFRAAFGLSLADGDRLLAYYLGSSGYRVMEFKLPPAGRGLAAPAPREATDGEIADLKADAYVDARFPEAAWGELMAAYQREKAGGGPVEPRLLAALSPPGADRAR